MDLVEGNQSTLTVLAQQNNWISTARQIVDLSVPGAGNMNRVLRARLDNNDTLIFKQALPYVAKYPDIAAPLARFKSEVAFYQVVQSTPAVQMRTPAVIGFDAQHHLLCLQDLGDVGDLSDLYNLAGSDNKFESPQSRKVPQGYFSALVYWLWKLHHIAVDKDQQMRLENMAMRKLNHAHIFEIPLQVDNGLELKPHLRSLAANFCANQKLVTEATILGEIYLGQRPHKSKPGLLHGDFYPGSWLAQQSMGIMVIDPEFGFFGPPEFDVGIMLGHLTLCGFDQAQIMSILQGYVPVEGFDYTLAMKFASMEVIRRLLGVAQLPIAATEATQASWLAHAEQVLCN